MYQVNSNHTPAEAASIEQYNRMCLRASRLALKHGISSPEVKRSSSLSRAYRRLLVANRIVAF